jgi:beta-N-acetylhexosaminidase
MDLKSTPFNLKSEDIEWVKETFDSLTIDEKLGQVFLPNISSLGFKGDLKDALKYKPGGVYLHMSFGNFHRRKVRYLQENSNIPMLVCADLEFGGFGNTINGTFFNTQMGIGATNSETHAYRFGKVMAREGKACGFNWFLSPVVDINYNIQNPIVNFRSFGDQPELVSRMACSTIRAIQDEGVIATAKHFPGDGVDDRDQHLVTTTNSFGFDRWKTTYGKVYRDVIKEGVKCIISAHISLPSYNSDEGVNVPASISRKLNEELLRKELGFNGLIAVDAVNMGGLNSQGPKKEILPKVLSSGCDVILFSDEREYDFNLLKESVETGIITEKRLNDAVMRVLGLKGSINLHRGVRIPGKKERKQIFKCEEHKKWSNESIKASITLVKDQQKLLPINSIEYNKVLLVRTGDFGIITRKFKSILKSKGFKVKKYNRGIRSIFRNYDLIVFLVSVPCGMAKNTLRMIELHKDYGMMRCVHNEVPTIFISLGNPYHLYEIPTLKTVINCYNPIVRTQRILVEMLLGNLPFKGVSPVDAFCGLEDAK